MSMINVCQSYTELTSTCFYSRRRPCLFWYIHMQIYHCTCIQQGQVLKKIASCIVGRIKATHRGKGLEFTDADSNHLYPRILAKLRLLKPCSMDEALREIHTYKHPKFCHITMLDLTDVYDANFPPAMREELSVDKCAVPGQRNRTSVTSAGHAGVSAKHTPSPPAQVHDTCTDDAKRAVGHNNHASDSISVSIYCKFHVCVCPNVQVHAVCRCECAHPILNMHTYSAGAVGPKHTVPKCLWSKYQHRCGRRCTC